MNYHKNSFRKIFKTEGKLTRYIEGNIGAYKYKGIKSYSVFERTKLDTLSLYERIFILYCFVGGAVTKPADIQNYLKNKKNFNKNNRITSRRILAKYRLLAKICLKEHLKKNPQFYYKYNFTFSLLNNLKREGNDTPQQSKAFLDIPVVVYISKRKRKQNVIFTSEPDNMEDLLSSIPGAEISEIKKLSSHQEKIILFLKEWLIKTRNNTYIRDSINELLLHYSFLVSYAHRTRNRNLKAIFYETLKTAFCHEDFQPKSDTKKLLTRKKKGITLGSKKKSR
jgi:hypothetical protein